MQNLSPFFEAPAVIFVVGGPNGPRDGLQLGDEVELPGMSSRIGSLDRAMVCATSAAVGASSDAPGAEEHCPWATTIGCAGCVGAQEPATGSGASSEASSF